MFGRIRYALGLNVELPGIPQTCIFKLTTVVQKRNHGLWHLRQAELSNDGCLSIFKTSSQVKIYDLNNPKKAIVQIGKSSVHVKIVTKDGRRLHMKIKGDDGHVWATRILQYKIPKDANFAEGKYIVEPIKSLIEDSPLKNKISSVSIRQNDDSTGGGSPTTMDGTQWETLGSFEKMSSPKFKVSPKCDYSSITQKNALRMTDKEADYDMPNGRVARIKKMFDERSRAASGFVLTGGVSPVKKM